MFQAILFVILFSSSQIGPGSCWNLNLNMINSINISSIRIRINHTSNQVIFNLNQNMQTLVLTTSAQQGLDFNQPLFVNYLAKNINSNTDLLKLDLTNNDLQKFPYFLLNNLFSNLKQLNLSNNLIANLSASRDFSSILCKNNLDYLDLSNNQIALIEDEMFRHLNSLKYLNLSKNQIKYISLFAFSVDSHNLIELDLSHNMITDISLEFLLFSNLVNLKHLNLNYNRLTSLSSHYLYNLYSLERLSIKYNSLKSFDLFYLINKNNEFLRYIDLSFNLNLKFIELNSHDPSLGQEAFVNNVEELSLAGIDLSSLNLNKFLDILFESYKNLKHLNLSSTRIKSMIWSTKWPTSIETIDLSKNLLKDTQFECSQFDLTTKSFRLKFIDLSNNRLKKFCQIFGLMLKFAQ